jgi:hypothetical protein
MMQDNMHVCIFDTMLENSSLWIDTSAMFPQLPLSGIFTKTYAQSEALSTRSGDDRARTRNDYVIDGNSSATTAVCGLVAPLDEGGTDTLISGPSSISYFRHQSERWTLNTPGLSSAALQLVAFHDHERDKDVDPGDGTAIRSVGAGKGEPEGRPPPAIPTGHGEHRAMSDARECVVVFDCAFTAIMQFVAGDGVPQPMSLQAVEDTASSDPRVLKAKEMCASPPLLVISVMFLLATGMPWTETRIIVTGCPPLSCGNGIFTCKMSNATFDAETLEEERSITTGTGGGPGTLGTDVELHTGALHFPTSPRSLRPRILKQ